MKKWLIRLHRYLAIGLSVPFVLWFASGIAMIYAGGMPRLTPGTRLERLQPIDLRQVRVSPVEAEVHARLSGEVDRVVLLTVMGRPAYRLSAAESTTIFADTGEPLGAVDAQPSVGIASAFLGVPRERLHYSRQLREEDQWTIGLSRELPLHRIEVEDGDRTVVYVSETLGEVVMLTNRRSRALAWVAAIPHWLYLTPLRTRERLWRQLVLWTSALGIVVTLAGLTLAVVQRRMRYVGLMRWHYRAGVLFGVFALTWVFSGWLSMQPWGWASSNEMGFAVNAALRGGRLDLKRFPAVDAAAWKVLLRGRAAKEIELSQARGEPLFVVRGSEPAPFVVSAHPFERRQSFVDASIIERLHEGFPHTAIAEASLLSAYDSYYRDRDAEAPLPVLRAKFADENRTWVYIDVATSALVAQFTRRQRLERWIYHGLHSLDFSFWYSKRPLWEVGVIALCLGGLTLSVIGFVMALRRVFRRSTSIHLSRGPRG